MSSPCKRRDMDLMKLMMTDYKVEIINDGMQEFFVEFHGPKDSPYQGGVWKIRVELPDAYPYKSGSVCLDVINRTWSPMFGPYQGGVWNIRVEPPDASPYKCPST
ncbi:hypothetical protein TSUD_76630 [Trifolium subterraneum]|uniref:UBC core domain-containing protein n=1 Tax=Trifolium subterraneum TaxID=3900 RepID=A0A2Z6LMR2_TRISU|nr:hypothetical protein TSUD_76630 [Trifolium subterraneum]